MISRGYGVAYDEDGIELFVHPGAPGHVIQFDFRNGRITEEDLRSALESEGIRSAPIFEFIRSESLLDDVEGSAEE